ncbi:MAG: hypothetical protein ABMA64_30275 [Myxococcota bacterium]
MITLQLWSAAWAQAPASPVPELVWARPFRLAAPEEDPNVRGSTLSTGWLVELRADPAWLVPSNGPEPWLYVGESHAWKLNWDHDASPTTGGCLVAVVSGPVDWATAPLFFGAPPDGRTTDEPARRSLARAEATRTGAAPQPRDRVDLAVAAGGPELAAHDLRDVKALGMARVGACTSTEADRMRAGAR